MISDLLPWLNLLLLPSVGLLVSISRQLASLAATQAAHAEQLSTLRSLPTTLAGVQATQTEHARRLDFHRRNGNPNHAHN